MAHCTCRTIVKALHTSNLLSIFVIAAHWSGEGRTHSTQPSLRQFPQAPLSIPIHFSPEQLPLSTGHKRMAPSSSVASSRLSLLTIVGLVGLLLMLSIVSAAERSTILQSYSAYAANRKARVYYRGESYQLPTIPTNPQP